MIESTNIQEESHSIIKEHFETISDNSSKQEIQENSLKFSQSTSSNNVSNIINNTPSFTLSNNLKTKREGNLIENFIVVGLPQDVKVSDGDKVSYDAKILYNYPPEKKCDPQIVGFCFPEGIKLIQVKRRRSLTDLNSVLFKSLSQLESSNSSFMFLITGGEYLLYAVCVLNTEMINELPSFFPNSNEVNNINDASNEENRFCFFTSRCYCVISRYPYFKSHFDFLYSIIGKERLYRTNKLLQNMNDLISNSTSIINNKNANNNHNNNLKHTTLVTPRRPMKPLPPLPSQITNSTGGNESPLEISPLFPSAKSLPSEKMSLLRQHLKPNNNGGSNNPISHSRSHSSPLNLKDIRSLQKLQNNPPTNLSSTNLNTSQESNNSINITPPINTVTPNISINTKNKQHNLQHSSALHNNNLNSSSSPIHILSDESLTAIQESLDFIADSSDIDEFSDFSSSTNSIENSLFDSISNGFSNPNSKKNSANSGNNSTINQSPSTQFYSTSQTEMPDIKIISPKPLPKVPGNMTVLNISSLMNPNGDNNNGGSSSTEDEKNKSLLDEELECIDYYSTRRVPKENEKLILHFPGDQNQSFYDSGEDIQLIESWCLGGLLKTLSLKTILDTLSCVLLEKFLLITSKNIGLISNTIFALLPLLKPYVYQGAFIPILPYNTLDALYCPVPFVIGITKIPNDMPDALSNCYILDIDKNTLIKGENCQPITTLPFVEKLEVILKHYHGEVWKEKSRQYSMDYPFKTSTSDIKYIHSLSQEIQIYNNYIIETIAYYINWNTKFDFGNLQHKEQLLKLVSPANQSFMTQFLTTQLFTSHTELLFESKTNSSQDVNINHYKINKL